MPGRLICYVWAAPTSACGIVFASILLISGASARLVEGVLEVSGGWLANKLAKHSGFAAITLGDVVLGYSESCLQQLRAHEHVHVRQAERWGVAFIPAYLCAGLWQWLCGRHAYYDHPFEREAFVVAANCHISTE